MVEGVVTGVVELIETRSLVIKSNYTERNKYPLARLHRLSIDSLMLRKQSVDISAVSCVPKNRSTSKSLHLTINHYEDSSYSLCNIGLEVSVGKYGLVREESE
jgi:hypothetical protein